MADHGEEGVLSPFLRARRFSAASPFLRGKILDVGCGSGDLCGRFSAGGYLGVDRDEESLALARLRHPEHIFQAQLPPSEAKFDTIVALAVIEHVPDPVVFLGDLAMRLREDSASCIVLTTPHPSMEIVHTLGAKIGLFSNHASEEHEDLLDKRAMVECGRVAGLRVQHYQRFLLGANQLCVFCHMP